MAERLRVTPIDTRLSIGDSFKIDEDFVIPYSGNRFIFATTEGGLQIVAKISQQEKSRREWMGLLTVYYASVPSPQPLLLGQTDERHFALISSRIIGHNMFYSPNLGLRYRLGRIVKSMHEQATTEGREWLVSGKSDFSYYDRKIDLWTRDIAIDQTTHPLLIQLSIPAPNYIARTLPVFNHNDIHDGQAIIEDTGRIVLIDFGNWCEDIPLNDIAFYLFHCIRTNKDIDYFASFMDGYLGTRKLTDEEKTVILFELLFISTRAVEYFAKKKSGYLDAAKETHKRVFAYIENETLFK